jgi:hypothetical protein
VTGVIVDPHGDDADVRAPRDRRHRRPARGRRRRPRQCRRYLLR